MMSEKKKQQRIIRHIRDQIVKHYGPEKIILFGSRVSGKTRRYSDFDIFVIKRTRKHPIERSIEVSSLFPGREFTLDVIVRTPSEVNRRLRWGDFFYKRILRTGRVLYEKS